MFPPLPVLPTTAKIHSLVAVLARKVKNRLFVPATHSELNSRNLNLSQARKLQHPAAKWVSDINETSVLLALLR